MGKIKINLNSIKTNGGSSVTTNNTNDSINTDNINKPKLDIHKEIDTSQEKLNSSPPVEDINSTNVSKSQEIKKPDIHLSLNSVNKTESQIEENKKESLESHNNTISETKHIGLSINKNKENESENTNNKNIVEEENVIEVENKKEDNEERLKDEDSNKKEETSKKVEKEVKSESKKDKEKKSEKPVEIKLEKDKETKEKESNNKEEISSEEAKDKNNNKAEDKNHKKNLFENYESTFKKDKTNILEHLKKLKQMPKTNVVFLSFLVALTIGGIGFLFYTNPEVHNLNNYKTSILDTYKALSDEEVDEGLDPPGLKEKIDKGGYIFDVNIEKINGKEVYVYEGNYYENKTDLNNYIEKKVETIKKEKIINTLKNSFSK